MPIFVLVMACCLTVPHHNLNQRWTQQQTIHSRSSVEMDAMINTVVVVMVPSQKLNTWSLLVQCMLRNIHVSQLLLPSLLDKMHFKLTFAKYVQAPEYTVYIFALIYTQLIRIPYVEKYARKSFDATRIYHIYTFTFSPNARHVSFILFLTVSNKKSCSV